MDKKKHSKKRDRIFQILSDTDTHPTAEWVYKKLKDEIPDLSLATVYRNITEFREEGKIRSVGYVHGKERFDAKIYDHPHFICDECGKFSDISDDIVLNESKIMEFEIASGNKINCKNILLNGVCNECLKKRNSL